jgi:hypothetical protein
MAETIELSNVSPKKNIFSHVFNFDEDTKNNLFNLAQYSILAIIPVIFLNKAIKHFFPEEDDKKTNLEVSIEIVTQLLALFFGAFFIHRLITYVPTYSKVDYPNINLFSVILIFMVIIFSIQTKIGKKVNVLVDRFSNYYSGKKPTEQEEQPEEIPEQIAAPLPRPVPQHQPSRSDSLGGGLGREPQRPSVQDSQPNFNQMFNNNIEPFVGGTGSIGGAPF